MREQYRPAELDSQEDEEAGDAKAETEGDHQHQLPPGVLHIIREYKLFHIYLPWILKWKEAARSI